MVGIIILCVIVLVFGVLLLTPVRARVSYDRGELAAWVRYGPVKVRLFPLKEVPKEEKRPKKKPAKEKQKKKEAKPKAGICAEQVLYSLEALPPILGRALRRTGRRVRFEPLKIHLLIATADPADTAQLYGRLEAALGAGLPALHRMVQIKDQDIRLFPDFVGDRIDCIADVGMVIRPWDVLAIVLPAGVSLVKWLLRFRKLAPPTPEETRGENKTGTTEAA